MRADKFFAERFGSRTKAAEAIEKGWVLVNGKSIRPKDEVKESDTIAFVETGDRFVSNGGYKLATAIQAFSFPCEGKTFVDLGASTGGFTDCLLQNGAAKVFAVDVGESQMHESLQGDNRITVMDNTNARYLTAEDFPYPIDCIVTDVSFISLRLIFPAISAILGEDGSAFVLVKPQFECENKHIGKSGIVHHSAHAAIVKKVLGYATDNGLYAFGIIPAPIRKGKNIEYVLYLKKTYQGATPEQTILETVQSVLKQISSGELG